MFKSKPPLKNQNCLNCQTSYDGWFCPQCGQKALTKRLTVLTVIKDFLEALSDSDRGFLKTVIDLSQNPGMMLQDYIDGKRQRYLSAGKYTFFLVVLFTVNLSYLESHFGFFETMTSMVDGLSITQDSNNIHLTDKKGQEALLATHPKAKGIINEGDAVHIDFDVLGTAVNKHVSKNEFLGFIKILLPKYHKSLFDALKIFIVLWIPIFSLFSFLFFRKNGFNFAEHITINSYIYSHLLLITMILSLSFWIFKGLVGTTLVTIFSATSFYLFFSYLQIFSTGRRRLLKTILSFGFGGLVYLTTLFCLILAQVLYIALINIDKL